MVDVSGDVTGVVNGDVNGVVNGVLWMDCCEWSAVNTVTTGDMSAELCVGAGAHRRGSFFPLAHARDSHRIRGADHRLG